MKPLDLKITMIFEVNFLCTLLYLFLYFLSQEIYLVSSYLWSILSFQLVKFLIGLLKTSMSINGMGHCFAILISILSYYIKFSRFFNCCEIISSIYLFKFLTKSVFHKCHCNYLKYVSCWLFRSISPKIKCFCDNWNALSAYSYVMCYYIYYIYIYRCECVDLCVQVGSNKG